MNKIIYHNTINRLDPSKWYLISSGVSVVYIVNSETDYHIYIYNGIYYKVIGPFNIYAHTIFNKIYDNLGDVLVDYPEILNIDKYL